MSYSPNTLSELDKIARDRGCVVVCPSAREIFLDIDSEADMEFFEKQREILEQKESVHVGISHSKTPGHYHVVITFTRVLDPWEKVALQACLGSDRKRELLAATVKKSGNLPGHNVFFERR